MLVVFFVFCVVKTGFAQEVSDSERVSRKNAVSLNVAGSTPLIGVTYERLMTDHFNFEFGLGLISVGTALKYFPWAISDNKMVFHTGLSTNIFSTPLDDLRSSDYSNITYLMIGLTYFGVGGFNFALDVGPSYNYDFTYNESSTPFYGSIKLGYRF